MRVIITGGSGLIGQALTKRLAVDGHEVVILSRSPERLTGLPGTALAVKWDARTAESWGNLVDSTTAIVNLAGASIGDSRWTAERKEVIIESRIHASEAVVEAVKAAPSKPEVVIQASAVGYYGNRGDEILTETSAPAENYFPADVCVQWEQAIRPIADDVRLVIIRTGIVLTTKGGALPKMLTPFRVFAGGPFGDGRQWFPWIHILDEVKAIAFLLRNKETSGVYNLSAPNILTNREFAKALGAVLRRPSFIPAPAPALRLALGEMSALVLDGQRAVSQKLQDAGFQFDYGQAGPALQDIIDNER